MSTRSPQEAAADNYQRTQASLAKQMADFGLPAIAGAGQRAWDTLRGFNEVPTDIAKVFGDARAGLEANFEQAGRVNAAQLQQSAVQSGGVFTTGQVDSAVKQAAFGLAKQKEQSDQRLNFQEATAGMDQFNTLVGFLGGGAQSALGLGRGFSQNQAGAIGGMSNQSVFGSTIGGASAGASAGSVAGPWGTLIGGVAGGAAGYWGSGG